MIEKQGLKKEFTTFLIKLHFALDIFENKFIFAQIIKLKRCTGH